MRLTKVKVSLVQGEGPSDLAVLEVSMQCDGAGGPTASQLVPMPDQDVEELAATLTKEAGDVCGIEEGRCELEVEVSRSGNIRAQVSARLADLDLTVPRVFELHGQVYQRVIAACAAPSS